MSLLNEKSTIIPKTIHENPTYLNKKKEIFDFYIDLLRKLELIKFSTNEKGYKKNSNLVDIEILKYIEEDDIDFLKNFTKLGTSYFSQFIF